MPKNVNKASVPEIKKDHTLAIIVGVVAVIALIITVFAFTAMKKPAMEGLKATLDKHSELAKFKQYPRVTYLTPELIDLIKANNPTLAENAKAGQYLLEYTGAVAIYDPKKDEIITRQEAVNAPNDILEKLTSKSELSSYRGLTGTVVLITEENLAGLREQINGLDSTYVGKYIITYDDRLIIYDYANDRLDANILLRNQQYADLLTKLNNHPELAGYSGENPQGQQLTAAALAEGKSNYPDIYVNAAEGDFVLRFSDLIVVYNYETDTLKDAFKIG
jgi:hypothetical protein